MGKLSYACSPLRITRIPPPDLPPWAMMKDKWPREFSFFKLTPTKVSEVFAYAKVKLLCSEVCAKLLCNFYAPSEVKFAHFAEGKTSLSIG